MFGLFLLSSISPSCRNSALAEVVVVSVPPVVQLLVVRHLLLLPVKLPLRLLLLFSNNLGACFLESEVPLLRVWLSVPDQLSLIELLELQLVPSPEAVVNTNRPLPKWPETKVSSNNSNNNSRVPAAMTSKCSLSASKLTEVINRHVPSCTNNFSNAKCSKILLNLVKKRIVSIPYI